MFLVLILQALVYLSLQQCHYSCQDCSDQNPQICTQCDHNQNRHADMSISARYQQCPCNSGFYDDGQNQRCQSCQYPCRSCLQSPFKCTECVRNDPLRMDYAVTYDCPCIPGYFSFRNDRNCYMCHASCKECIGNARTCIRCHDPATTFRIDRSNHDFTCPCIDGYFDGNQRVCQVCRHPCLTCVVSAVTCLSCHPEFKLDWDRKQCEQCPLGEYGYGGECLPCHYSCRTCRFTDGQCFSCNTQNTNRVDQSQMNNTCPCQDQYYDDEGLFCEPCSPSCFTCERSPSRCTSCWDISISNRIDRSFTHLTCPCREGYFWNDLVQTCIPCHDSCQECVGELSSQCYECFGGFQVIAVRRLNGRSIGYCISQNQVAPIDCDQGYFHNLERNTCDNCGWMCVECSHSPNHCLVCGWGLSLIQNNNNEFNCECPQGLYLSGRKCYPLCSEGQYYPYQQLNDQQKECYDSSQDSDQKLQCQCLQCEIEHCQVCVNIEQHNNQYQLQCILCRFGYRVRDGRCWGINQTDIATLDIGCSLYGNSQYSVFNSEQPQCIDCPFGCQGCALDSHDLNGSYKPSCSRCYDNFTLLANQFNLDSCEPQFQCPQGCLKCDNRVIQLLNHQYLQNQCYVCHDNYTLVLDKCILVCDGQQVEVNQDGQCVEISQQCNRFKLYDAQYVCQTLNCGRGYFTYSNRIQDICIKCPCSECWLQNNNDIQSVECTSNQQLELSICDLDHTGQIQNNTCLTCNISGCIRCNTQVILINDYNQENDYSQCYITPQNIPSNLGQTISFCPVAFTDMLVDHQRVQCISCPSDCLICTTKQLQIVCQLCEQGYYLHNYECLPSYHQIVPLTQPIISSGCGLGYYSYEYGYRTYCQACNILQGQPSSTQCLQCLSASPQHCTMCNLGHYVDHVFGLCRPCSDYCSKCESKMYCRQCHPGYYRSLSFNYSTQEYEVVCLESCDGYPLLTSQITENFDSSQYMIPIANLFAILQQYDGTLNKYPSSQKYDYEQQIEPDGLTDYNQAIHLDDSILIGIDEIPFNLNVQTQQRLICSECLNRCNSCRGQKTLNLQNQMCVQDCNLPFFKGKQKCEVEIAHMRFKIQVASRVELLVGSDVALQNHLDNLIISLRWENVPQFQFVWTVYRVGQEQHGILEDYQQFIDGQQFAEDFYINDFLQTNHILQTDIEIPFFLLKLDQIYMIKIEIQTASRRHNLYTYVHVINRDSFYHKQNHLDRLNIIDQQALQRDIVFFTITNFQTQRSKKTAIISFYPKLYSVNNFPLWSMHFDLQHQHYGAFILPALMQQTTLQLSVYNNCSLMEDLFIAAQKDYVGIKINFNFTKINLNRVTIQQLDLTINDLLNMTINLIEQQLYSEQMSSHFNHQTEGLNQVQQCSLNFKIHQRIFDKSFCICQSFSKALFCQDIDHFLTTYPHHINALVELTITTLLFVKSQNNSVFMQYQKLGQIISVVNTISQSKIMTQSIMLFLYEIVQQISYHKADYFIYNLNNHKKNIDQERPENLGDIGRYLQSISRVIYFSQWFLLQKKDILMTQNLTQNKDLSNSQKFLQRVQVLIMNQIRKLSGFTSIIKPFGYFLIGQGIYGFWTQIDQGQLQQSLTKIDTLLITRKSKSTGTIFPELQIPSMALIQFKESSKVYLVTSCIKPSLADSYFQSQIYHFAILTDICGFFLYNDQQQRINFKSVFQEVQVRFPYLPQYSPDISPKPDKRYKCLTIVENYLNDEVCNFIAQDIDAATGNIYFQCRCLISKIHWVFVTDILPIEFDQINNNSSSETVNIIEVNMINVFPSTEVAFSQNLKLFCVILTLIFF